MAIFFFVFVRISGTSTFHKWILKKKLTKLTPYFHNFKVNANFLRTIPANFKNINNLQMKFSNVQQKFTKLTPYQNNFEVKFQNFFALRAHFKNINNFQLNVWRMFKRSVQSTLDQNGRRCACLQINWRDGWVFECG